MCVNHPDASRVLPRSNLKRGITLSEGTVFNPNQSAADLKKARDELHEFVRKFFRALKAVDGPNSCLQVFCRIDVAITADASSYFINEVERGITTSLWVHDGDHAAGLVGMSIVQPLKRWVVAEKQRISTSL